MNAPSSDNESSVRDPASHRKPSSDPGIQAQLFEKSAPIRVRELESAQAALRELPAGLESRVAQRTRDLLAATGQLTARNGEIRELNANFDRRVSERTVQLEAPSWILLVEDNPEDVMFLERAFEKAGCPVRLRTISDGQEALDYLAGSRQFADRKEHPLPNHVLLDLKLPHKSGLEILEWLRGEAALKAVRVIAFTSSSIGADSERARALGVDACFVKPVRNAELIETAREIASLWKLAVRTSNGVASSREEAR